VSDSPARPDSASAPGEKNPPPVIAVLGAGPVGLDAALAGVEAGYRVMVFEASSRPAGNVRDWGHVSLFTPWSMSISPRMKRKLRELGREVDEAAGTSCPTGHELADQVFDPIWFSEPLRSSLRLGTRVVAVGREGVLKHEEIGSPERHERAFRILVRDAAGREWVERADIVLDCTGKYGRPNALGDGGIPAPGEIGLQDRITSRIPDLASESGEWAGHTILLAGAGHSAQTAARDLAELAVTHPRTRILWAIRRTQPDLGLVENDPLPSRRALTEDAGSLLSGASAAVEALAGAVVESMHPENGSVRVDLRHEGGKVESVKVDRILSLTGGVGDDSLYRQLQVHECYAFAAPMKLSAALLGSAGGDCLEQESHGVEALKNPEPDFFILGDKSYGRNNTFLLQVGWQQVDEVFADLGQNT
jgi:hypothetical protein